MAFAPVFQRPFSGTFDRHAAAAAAAAWYVVAGKTCVAAYQPKGAASLAASYTNLANPGTYDAVPGATPPTWNASYGWDMALASSLSLCTITVSPDQSQSLAVKYSAFSVTTSDASVGTGILYGELSLTPRHYGLATFFNSGSAAQVYDSSAGVLMIAGNKGYINGALVTSIAAGAGKTADMQVFGGRNEKIAAIAIYSDTLTADEVATVSAAMAAL